MINLRKIVITLKIMNKHIKKDNKVVSGKENIRNINP